MRTSIACALLLILMTGCYSNSEQPQSGDSTKQPESATKAAPDENEGDAAASSEEAVLADALTQIQSGKALLVDVRSDEEWNEAHFENAQHISIDKISEDAGSAFESIDKQQTVFLH